MLRLFAALAIPTLILLTAPAAPVPKAKPQKQPFYFPTTVGDTWVQHSEPPGSSRDVTQTVTAVERKGGDTIVTVAMMYGNASLPCKKVLVSEAGIFWLSEITNRKWHDYMPPLPILKLPIKLNSKWKVETTIKNSVCTGSGVISKIEEIEVPAGKFKAVRIEWNRIRDGKPYHSTSWYAPRVGLVKFKNDSRVVVLKSFTPGKEKD